ncbi:hypothetical protein AB8A20_20880 [Tardiphaga sp. 604_B6_N1_1]|uniref:hypothetical protein n=1 Tax=Tardiphaga sp. 604_B6_N1_1 TaxID=3240779 RepID=UPI003F1F56A5
MIDEIDGIIDEWPTEKLEMVSLRARLLLKKRRGREKGDLVRDKYHDAVQEAAHRIRREQKQNPLASKKWGWEIKQIRQEISDAPEFLKPSLSTERAIRRAITTGVLQRIKAK